MRPGASAESSAFRVDARGNFLHTYKLLESPGSTGHELHMRAAQPIVAQILRLRTCGIGYRILPRQTHDPFGMQRLAGSGSPDPRVLDLLDLLRQMITLQPSPYVDFALALDWYKRPVDGVDPDDWANSAAGDLVHRGKYWKSTPREQREAGQVLTGGLITAIEQHPLLRAADAVLPAPSHDRSRLGFGEKLAFSVAAYRSWPFVRVNSARPLRPEAKNMTEAERRALLKEFMIDDDLNGLSVVVVDDVFRRGSTMSGVAAAARRAGAVRVAGLVGARTLRR